MAVAAVVLGIAAAPAAAGAAVVPVTSMADSGPGTLRDRIDTAPAGSTIVVPAGTIKLASELDIGKQLEIDGAGATKTTISGNDASRVFSLTGATGVKIARLGIVHGHVSVPGSIGQAAGVRIAVDSSLTLLSARVVGNVTDTSGDATHPSNGITEGGGVYNDGTLDLVATTVTGNVARSDGTISGQNGGLAYGGGVYSNGHLSISSSSVSSNVASALGNGTGHGGLADGGGVISLANDLSITTSTINGNVARGDGGSGGAGQEASGGGLRHTGGSLSLNRTTVGRNTASAIGGPGQAGGGVEGAGVYVNINLPSKETVTDSRISANVGKADGGLNGAGQVAHGGGWYDAGGSELTMTNSTLDANHAMARGFGTGAGGGTQGGGLYADSPTTMTNATVTSNGVDAGGGAPGGTANAGGVYVNDTITFLNSTIADNSAAAASGSARGGNLTDGGLTSHVKNTIVSGGHADAGYENCRDTFTSDGHNIDSLDQCGFHNPSGDQTGKNPLLAPLHDNGGPVPTRRLLPLSPAIDKGDNTGCPGTDARGAPRPSPPGGLCDVGAYEVSKADLAITKNGPKRVVVGRPITWTLEVKNLGPPAATSVTVRDGLPAKLRPVSAHSTRGLCTLAQTVVCNVGTLAKGASAKVRVVATAVRTGKIKNTARVLGAIDDPKPSNNAASASTKARAVSLSGLSVSPARFGGKKGPSKTTVRFKLTGPATVRLSFARKHKGHFVSAGSLSVAGHIGKNGITFAGELSGRRLKAGVYRLTAVAVDVAHDHSRKARTSFKFRG